MNKYPKVFIILAGILIGLSLLGLYFFLGQYRSKPEQNMPEQSKTEEKQVEEFVENPQRGDLGYQETQTKIQIGTQGVTKGAFEKVEEGSIFLKEGDSLTELPLTLDEVAVNCTTQDLSSATELDFNQITEVKVSTPAEVGTLIPEGEAVVVFSSNVEGVNRAHTIAMAGSKCGPQ